MTKVPRPVSVRVNPKAAQERSASRMTERLTLGYRTTSDGTTGHEFHRTVVEPRAGAEPAWRTETGAEGYRVGGVVASYLHTHWAATPEVAQRLVAACD